MRKIAFLFPGQGAQYRGMGHDLYTQFECARRVFEEADVALGFPLSKLCFEGPSEQLQLTENTQPAILTVSVAAAEVLREAGIRPDYVAGHSLGEYSALAAAGAIRLSDAVRLVRKRGQFMQEAVPVGRGAMAALLGLDLAVVVEICRDAAQDEVVRPANLNCPGQVVIAGHATAVARAMDLGKRHGAKRAVTLEVSAPFHSPLMKPAAARLSPELDQLEIRDPEVPLVNNADAQIIWSAETIRDGLKRQVSSPVCWEDSMRRLRAEGVETFIEVGPGKVLSGLLRQIDRQAQCLRAGDLASLNGTLARLGPTVAKVA